MLDWIRIDTLVDIAIGASGFALWFLLFALALLATRPAKVPPTAPTQEFGGEEPPAVVSMLVSDWELTEDAAESTLIDLAARGFVEFRQPGNDPVQTTLHIREPAPRDLNAYERRVFDRVAGLAVEGVLPLTALTFRDANAAKGWRKRLNAEIVADARRRGLSQRRFSPAIRAALTAAALIPSATVMIGILRHAGIGNADAWGALIPVLVFVFGGLSGYANASRGERDTPLGREAAARWLGLKAYLRNDESFADLPPAAVAVWDRYLSYGDAVGATRVCAAVIDLGMGNRRRVWSSFGGTWHRVRVRYPRFWPRYGRPPARLVVKAVAAIAASLLIIRYGPRVADYSPADFADPVDLVLGALTLLGLGYGGYTLAGVLVDLLTPVTVTGEVLWLQPWRSTSAGEDRPSVPWLHYLAVDDGREDRTVAWACPSALAYRAHCGDIVTFTARRWTRRVVDLRVDERSAARALHAGDAAATGDAEQYILDAMGVQRQPLAAALLRSPELTPARLMSVEEVSRVVGQPVTAKGLAATVVGPTTVESYHGADGRRLLIATLSTGPVATLAMRMHRRNPPLPGIGDEAYAGDGWVVGWRGDRMVTLRLHGPAKRVAREHLAWLLATAVGRLPEEVSDAPRQAPDEAPDSPARRARPGPLQEPAAQ